MATTPNYSWVMPDPTDLVTDLPADFEIFGDAVDATVYTIDQEVDTTRTTSVLNAQTASYTLVLADAGKTITMSVASANNLTVPLNSSVAFATGTMINVIQIGAGQTTLVATSGVTINSKEGKLKLTGQYSGVSLYKRDTNTWVAVGDLSA
jgi:hypothetical protein